MNAARRGPLAGVRVLEFVSIGPGPHCAMLLADMGAEVLRIDRDGGNGWQNPVADRGRAVLTLDIRSDSGRSRCLGLSANADVVIEGFRPGVMERLGLGPDAMGRQNPRLIYGRITGWGREGPLAQAAGHDINYIALSGALAAIGEPGGRAIPPLNLVGDFGGGSLFLAFGIVAALYEREQSGRGQVVDAAIVDGVASLMSMFTGLLPSGRISLEREASLLGGAAPFYRTYLCADGSEVSVGPLEPHFYRILLEKIGAPLRYLEAQYDRSTWEEQSAALAAIFASQDRTHWCRLLEGTDACFAPVLTLAEAQAHPQNRAREVYRNVDGYWHAAAAPRLSRTPGSIAEHETAAALLERWASARS